LNTAPPAKPPAWNTPSTAQDTHTPDGLDGSHVGAPPARRTRFRADELQAMTFPPQRFAVPELVPEGLSILAGAPKLGKSWMALEMALAVASGGRFLGALPVEQGPALVLALEDGQRRLRDRMEMLLGPGEPFPRDLHVWLDKPSRLLDELDEHLADEPETRLVIIDTLGKVRPPSPAGGPTYADDYRVAGSLQRFAIERGLAVLVVHHTRKGRGDDFVEGVSGTYGITGAADAVILLDRDRGADGALLHVTGRDLRDDLAWRLDRVGPAWHLVEKVRADAIQARQGLGDTAARIVEAVSRAGEPVGANEIALALGVRPELAKDYLGRLARDGRLHRPTRGRYTLPTGDAVASVALSPSSTPQGGDSRYARDESDTSDAYDTPPRESELPLDEGPS